MTGPRDPWRWSGLSKRAIARIERRMFERLQAVSRGRHVVAEADRDLLDGLGLVEPRETRPRDRSLRGKARRHARKAATS